MFHLSLRSLRGPAVAAALLQVAPAEAQSKREHVLGGRALAPSNGAQRKVTSTEGGSDAREVVQRIISAIGIPATNIDVRASSDVTNAEATTENEGRERFILYNPTWMSNLRSSATAWSDWVVLAHEVGHHIAFHMDPSFPNHQAELQADYFAGFILHKLGAPLVEVQLAMAMLSTDLSTPSHPARGLRVAEVRKGWNAAGSNVGANIIPAAMPVGQLPAATSLGATPGKPAPMEPAVAEQRVALLIGNSNYSHWTKLKNPKNDVIAVGRELRRLGFSTTVLYDGTAAQIASALTGFRDDAAAADWAIVYFAGSGVEFDGINYMAPIDVGSARRADFIDRYPEMRLDRAFAAVAGAKRVRLVVADACRIDPDRLPGTPTAFTPGHNFKVVEPPRGVVVAYSTAAGQYAQDGSGELSPYASAFVAALREPGIELPKVFRRVSAAVETQSKGTQVPSVLGNWPPEDLDIARK